MRTSSLGPQHLSRWVWAVGLLVSAAGCSQGIDGPPEPLSIAAIGSCTRPQQGDPTLCVQYLGGDFTSVTATQSCVDDDATYSTEPCASAGVVGRCRINQATRTEYKLVYYAPTGTLAAQADCIQRKGTFYAP